MFKPQERPEAPVSDPGPLHSLKETAERAGCGRSTIIDRVLDGRLPSVRIGRRRMLTHATYTRILTEGID